MKLITLGGLLAPFVTVISVLNNDVVKNNIVNSQFGDASNLSELILIFLLSLPIMFSSIAMMLRFKFSLYVFIVGWLIISVSPYLLLSVREQFEDVFIGDTINTILGLVLLGGYLHYSKEVNKYLSQNKNK